MQNRHLKQKWLILGLAILGLGIASPDWAWAYSKSDIEKNNKDAENSCANADSKTHFLISIRDEKPDDGGDSIPWKVCRYEPANDTSNTVTVIHQRQADPDSKCNHAGLYELNNGLKCDSAQKTIESVQGQAKVIQAANTFVATGLQAYNASQPAAATQQQAYDQTKTNLKLSIASGLTETMFNASSAMRLNQAESDANSAASGIQGARAAYTDAENAARAAANNQAGILEEKLAETNDLKRIQEAAKNEQEAKLAANVAGTQNDAYNKALEDRQKNIQAGVTAFQKKLQESGSGAEETTRNNFDSFEQYRFNTTRGVQEAKDVAEEASAAASIAGTQALGGFMQTAIALGQLRDLNNTQDAMKSLTSVSTPPPTFMLDGTGRAPQVPVIPGGSVSPAVDLPLDEGGDLAAAAPRDPVPGGFASGLSFGPGQVFKPRKVEASSASGRGGIGGAGGGGDNSKKDKPRPNYGSGSTDYASGGRAGSLNRFADSTKGNSDLQDAVKALMGDGKSEADRVQEYRELASLRSQNQSNPENSQEDMRTIFERVKEKYNDVVTKQGMI